MDSTTYVTGARMGGLVRNLEIIAANLANANTPGFKQTVGTFHAELQRFAPWASLPGAGASIQPHWPELGDVRMDFSEGPLRATGRPLDIAVRGGAFLAVDTPAGRRYTRKGRLHMNSRGELVDGTGNTFVDEAGGTVRIPPGTESITISVEGEVVADEQTAGRLMLVMVKPALLAPEGGGLFRLSGNAPRPQQDPHSQVLQGYVEESNSSPIESLVALIEVNRAYEAAARVLKRMDQVSGQLIKAAA
jgi:flagellar basal-body rod protein FlgF